MNETEALELITYTRAKWGNAAAVPTDKRLLSVVVLAWMDALADVDPLAVRAVLADADDEFPPTPKAIRNRVDRLNNHVELPSWDEFWLWVRGVASHSSQFLPERGLAQRTSVDCPWPALAPLVTPQLVAGWAAEGLTEHDLEMVVQAHMRRQFDARTERIQREIASDVPALTAWKGLLDAAKAIGHPGELDEAS